MRNATRAFAAALMLLCFVLPSHAAENPLNWINTPEAYFATAEERAQWGKVLTERDAEQFIDSFWKKRGAEFKKDVEARIERADKLFSLAGRTGSQTEKGRVWMILGSPTRQKVTRSDTAEIGIGISGVFQNNSVERGAIESTQWIYQRDRLPKELGIPELSVNFQTNTARGQQVIENLGAVEPVLTRAVALLAAKTAATRLVASAPPKAVPPTASVAAPSLPDPLWTAEENAAGTFLTSEASVSPTDKSFYAVSFYIPKSTQAFEGVTNVVFAGLVKDAAGQQVAAVRNPVALKNYGDGGDRHVDDSVPLPPGSYDGVFALLTADGATTLAKQHLAFEIPQRGKTHVGALLTTGNIEVFDKQAPFDPFTFVATKYSVKGDRKFRTSDKVGLFAMVADPAGEADPTVLLKMTVIKNAKVLDRVPAQNAPLLQTSPHTWMWAIAFDPGTFQPGHYAIEVLLRDMKAAKESDAYQKGFVRRAEFDVVVDAQPAPAVK